MEISYYNSTDSVNELKGKKVILNCSQDSSNYAGIILIKNRCLFGIYTKFLVFVGVCPHNCEFYPNRNNELPLFDIDVSMFKTSMYVGKGYKEFDYVIQYSESDVFLNEWKSIYKNNIANYDYRVKQRKSFN